MTNKVVFADSPNLDAFGRIRISNPFTFFEHKNVYDGSTEQYHEITSGAGANVTFVTNASLKRLTVGTTSGDLAYRQSTQYITYVPGKSQQVILTGRFASSKANVSQRMGLFDHLNGVFMHDNGSNMGIVIRTSTSGSVVNNRVAQSSWNIDKLDGTGASGITIDFTKMNIYIIDFQWLGVGRVRFCIDHKGACIPFHQVINDNIREVPYMQTASLPIKYEIENDGTSASETSMDEVCATVVSEGGFKPPGYEHFVDSTLTLRQATSTADTPILAYRLKSAYSGKENRRTAELLAYKTYAESNAALFKVVHCPEPASSTGTWTSVDNASAVEYSTDISTIGAGSLGKHTIDGGYVVAGGQGVFNPPGSGGNQVQGNKHALIYQNVDSTVSDIMVIVARSQTGTADVAAGMDFVEFD